MKARILNVTAFLSCMDITGGKHLCLITDDGRGLELVIPENITEMIKLSMVKNYGVSKVVYEDDSYVKKEVLK